MKISKKEKWPETKTKGFVGSYLKKTCLWDTRNPEYEDKAKKEIAYNSLMKEFKISNTAMVKNKIRILRTTFTQEVKRAHLDINYIPKLCWFNDMDQAFNLNGKAKTFKKFANVKQEAVDRSIKIEQYSPFPVKVKPSSISLDPDPVSNTDTDSNSDSDATEIIIEPYELTFPVDDTVPETPQSPIETRDVGTVRSSTGLFLASLRPLFEQCTDQQNTLARVKIQEVLYNIIYDKSKNLQRSKN